MFLNSFKTKNKIIVDKINNPQSNKALLKKSVLIIFAKESIIMNYYKRKKLFFTLDIKK